MAFLKTFQFPGFLVVVVVVFFNKIEWMTGWTTLGFLTPTLQQIIPPGRDNVWKWVFRHVTDGKLWHIKQASSTTRGALRQAPTAEIICKSLPLTQPPRPLVWAGCQHGAFCNFLTLGTARRSSGLFVSLTEHGTQSGFPLWKKSRTKLNLETFSLVAHWDPRLANFFG